MGRLEAIHYLKVLREFSGFQPEIREALDIAIYKLDRGNYAPLKEKQKQQVKT